MIECLPEMTTCMVCRLLVVCSRVRRTWWPGRPALDHTGKTPSRKQDRSSRCIPEIKQISHFQTVIFFILVLIDIFYFSTVLQV